MNHKKRQQESNILNAKNSFKWKKHNTEKVFSNLLLFFILFQGNFNWDKLNNILSNFKKVFKLNNIINWTI